VRARFSTFLESILLAAHILVAAHHVGVSRLVLVDRSGRADLRVLVVESVVLDLVRKQLHHDPLNDQIGHEPENEPEHHEEYEQLRNRLTVVEATHQPEVDEYVAEEHNGGEHERRGVAQHQRIVLRDQLVDILHADTIDHVTDDILLTIDIVQLREDFLLERVVEHIHQPVEVANNIRKTHY
jgi:hypothetical protein